MTFVHLHTHSEYSLLDGASRLPKLVQLAAEMGQPAIAVTDHGIMSGAVKLQQEAGECRIKPIIGCELYVTSGSMEDSAKHVGDNYHLTVLAKNRAGYLNLMRLTTEAHVRGFSYRPRVDHALLGKYADGLIVLSGCIGAEVQQLLVGGREGEAERLISWYQDVYGDDFWIEVMNHGQDESGLDCVREEKEDGSVVTQSMLNDELAYFAKTRGIGMVATNDAHYLTAEDGEAHDTLICIGTAQWKEKRDRFQFPGAGSKLWEFQLKTEKQMRGASRKRWWREACDNTVLIADQVESGIIALGDTVLPRFKIPRDDVGFLRYQKDGSL